ncbi:hypothetical protein A0257_07155 [Hymenobacter psoromatis]|nr:hypothetical protein A0257_07155 [Hymenobacter psoromatis]
MKNSLPLLALTTLLCACSSNAGTPPAEATASTSTLAATTVGEQFLEALTKEDSIKVKELLSNHIVMLGSSAKQRITGKDSVATSFFGKKTASNFKAMPVAKSGDANMVYYTGFYSQDILPSAKYKQGGVGTGSYMLIARKDNKNDWKVSYLHVAQTPLQLNK